MAAVASSFRFLSGLHETCQGSADAASEGKQALAMVLQSYFTFPPVRQAQQEGQVWERHLVQKDKSYSHGWSLWSSNFSFLELLMVNYETCY